MEKMTSKTQEIKPTVGGSLACAKDFIIGFIATGSTKRPTRQDLRELLEMIEDAQEADVSSRKNLRKAIQLLKVGVMA